MKIKVFLQIKQRYLTSTDNLVPVKKFRQIVDGDVKH